MKTVKLMIPVMLTLVEREKNKSSSDTCPSNLWIRSFPHCKHEREKITESWQVLEIGEITGKVLEKVNVAQDQKCQRKEL